jgi:hypothetical protein
MPADYSLSEIAMPILPANSNNTCLDIPLAMSASTLTLCNGQTKRVTASNSGTIPMNIVHAELLGDGFSCANHSLPNPLAPNQQAFADIHFNAPHFGTFPGSLVVYAKCSTTGETFEAGRVALTGTA